MNIRAKRFRRMALFLYAFLGTAGFSLFSAPDVARGQSERVMTEARRQLVDRELIGGGIKNARVLDAMQVTPREKFVPANVRAEAYFDTSLPIGYGQTISSPFVVASMTEAINPQPGDNVLEIGTGSGYQAAVLSPLVKSVYSIEIVEPLAKKAEKTLKTLKYNNVYVRAGDGYEGWPEAAPFDKIIVTCSPESPPPKLVEQLKEGGLMVVPLGERYAQNLCLLTKKGGKMESQPIRPILFVPMTGDAEKTRQVQPDPRNPQLANGGFEEIIPGQGAAAQAAPGVTPSATTESDSVYQEARQLTTRQIGEMPAVWCYLRQAGAVGSEDVDVPEGKYCMKFENQTLGRFSQACQGIGIDGRAVNRLNITLEIKGKDIYPDVDSRGFPGVYAIFIDDKRNSVKSSLVGGWKGTFGWRKATLSLTVPQSAREAILYFGLHGAKGTLWVDNVQIQGVREK